MNTKTTLSLFAVVAVAGSLVAWLGFGDVWTTPASLPAAPAEVAGLRLEVGEFSTYRLLWDTSSEVAMPGATGDATTVSTSARLEAVVRFDTVATTADTLTRNVQIETIHDLAVDAAGKDLGAHWWDLVGPAAVATYSPSGELLEVGFDDEAPETFRSLMNVLLTTGQAIVPSPAARTTALGTVELENSGHGLQLTQRHVRYRNITAGLVKPDKHEIVQGETEIHLRADGELLSLRVQEELRGSANEAPVLVAKTRLVLERTGGGASGAVASKVVAHDKPGVAPELTDAQRQGQLRERAGTLEAAEVIARVAGYDGTDDETGEFMWRSTARVRLEPELAAQLAAVATAAATPQPGRELALDVLAFAGTPEAQAALRDSLDDGALRGNPNYALLAQRLSFVSRPDSETVAYVERLWSEPDGRHRPMAAYVLGAISNSLRTSGAPGEAARTAKLLRVAVASSSAEDRPHIIQGLGNARDPLDEGLFVALLTAPGEAERIAAATALRNYDSPAVRQGLLTLVGDPSIGSQRAALTSLKMRQLDDAGLRLLREHVAAERLGRSNDPLLVNLLSKQREATGTAQCLEAILARSDDDPRLRARIRALLELSQPTGTSR